MSKHDFSTARLRDGETTDENGHASRTNKMVRDGRQELARQELAGDYHRCYCGKRFEDLEALADHDCGGDAGGD